MMLMVLTATPFFVFALVAFARHVDPQTGRIYRSRQEMPICEQSRLALLHIDIAARRGANESGANECMCSPWSQNIQNSIGISLHKRRCWAFLRSAESRVSFKDTVVLELQGQGRWRLVTREQAKAVST